MIRQLSFLYEGERYVTLFGASEFLAQSLIPGSNVARYTDILTKQSASVAYKKDFGSAVREVLFIPDAVVTKAPSGMYMVTGHVTIDNVEHNCSINATGVTIEGLDEEAKAVEQPAEAATVSTETTVEDVNTDAEEKVDEEVESAPTAEEVEQTENKAEQTVAAVEESKQEEPLPDVEPVEEEDIVEEITYSIDAEDYPTDDEVRAEKPTFKTNVMDVEMSGGIKFTRTSSDAIQESVPGKLIGKPDRNAVGLMFHGTLPTQNNGRTRREPETEETPFLLPQNRMVNVPPTVHAKDSMTALQRALIEAQEREAQEREVVEEVIYEEPTEEVVEEEVSEEPAVSKEAAKKEFRSKLSAEINEVIGRIPGEMLGPITEFTTNPINTEALEKRGDLYCIDNRWHKVGKWFCIDCVANLTRHFYNSRQNISIAIPINVCKEWLRLTRGDVDAKC